MDLNRGMHMTQISRELSSFAHPDLRDLSSVPPHFLSFAIPGSQAPARPLVPIGNLFCCPTSLHLVQGILRHPLPDSGES